MPEANTDTTESTTTETTTTETGGTDGGSTGSTAESFTQDDLTRVGTEQHRRGKQEAAKALATELGMSVGDAKKILESHAKAEEAKKDETDRAKEAEAAAVTKAAEAERNLRQVTLRATLLEALTSGDGKEIHPVDPGYRDSAIDLALVHASRSETEDMETLVAEAAAHVRKTAPVFFGPGTGAGPANGTPRPPTKTGDQSGSTTTDAASEAARMLAAHKPKVLDPESFGTPPKPPSE